ncbi:MAG TPA: prolipoprotein diacylglyceryl transferase [Clostridia bacterium]|nr:prolipoprotein diacylglyceryl transferase [Clostridia bacterium]
MKYIEFPGFGLKFNIDPIAFKIGSLEIYWYGIIIGIGFLVAMILALRQCKKYDIPDEDVIDVVMWGAIFAMLGAKIYYVVFNWSIYNNILEIFTSWQEGLAIYGGIIGATLGALICCKIKKKDFLKLMDYLIVFFPLGQTIGRWANFVNQEAYGNAVVWKQMPWRMQGSNIIEGAVHPTFLYESLWCLLVFIFLLWFRNRTKLKGEVLSAYLVTYAIGRFFIEGIRTDSLMLGSFRISQLLSALLIIVIGGLFIFRRYELKHSIFKDEEPELETNIVDELAPQDQIKNEAEWKDQVADETEPESPEEIADETEAEKLPDEEETEESSVGENEKK